MGVPFLFFLFFWQCTLFFFKSMTHDTSSILKNTCETVSIKKVDHIIKTMFICWFLVFLLIYQTNNIRSLPTVGHFFHFANKRGAFCTCWEHTVLLAILWITQGFCKLLEKFTDIKNPTNIYFSFITRVLQVTHSQGWSQVGEGVAPLAQKFSKICLWYYTFLRKKNHKLMIQSNCKNMLYPEILPQPIMYSGSSPTYSCRYELWKLWKLCSNNLQAFQVL